MSLKANSVTASTYIDNYFTLIVLCNYIYICIYIYNRSIKIDSKELKKNLVKQMKLQEQHKDFLLKNLNSLFHLYTVTLVQAVLCFF